MNQDQIQSLVRSVLKVVGAILVTHGASKAAAIVNTEDVAGIIVAPVGFYMSHKQHADPATPALLTSCPTISAHPETPAPEPSPSSAAAVTGSEAPTPAVIPAPVKP
jgi:hypothetical protein